MKSSASWAALLVALPLLAGDKPWTIDDLMRIPAISDPQLRPDGGSVAYNVRELDASHNRYRTTMFVLDLGSGKSVATPGVSSPRWSPDGKSLAYVSSRDGSAQVYLASNPPRRITQSKSGVQQFRWSGDGQSIAYVAIDPLSDSEAARIKAGDDVMVAGKNYKWNRIYVQKLAGGAPQLITKADRQVVSFDWSADGKKFVYAGQETPRGRDVFSIDIFEVDAASGKETPLVVQPGRDADPSYSPDGRWVAFHSQTAKPNYFEERNVGLIPSGGGSIRYLSQGKDFDVFRGGNRFFWSNDGRDIYYTAGKSVHDYLYRQNLQSGDTSVVAENVSGSFSFSSDGSTLAYLKTALDHPAEVVVSTKGSEKQVTHVFAPLAEHPRVSSRVVRWKSRDGLAIEGILWLPFNYREGNRVPVIAELHGGPTGVIIDAFPSPRTYPTQVFLQNGIGVFAPNFRGGINYGAPFRLKTAEAQGFGDFDDVNTGLDKLIADGIADGDRLGVMGWSYGGYLSVWTIGHTNRFKAASVGAPATDWTTYYGQFDGSPQVLWTYFGGTPWAHPENYARHSPRSSLPNIKTPTLLQVGDRDINHNAEIYQALTDHNIPVEYTLYPREPHGFLEPAHQRDLMERNFAWFTRWIPK